MAASIMLNLPPITGSLISREKFPTFPPSITLSRSLNCPISSSFSSSYKCASIIISSRSSGKLSIPNAVQEEGTLTTHSPTAESSSSDELQQNPIGSTKKSVLVVGGTGGVVVATLLNRNVKTRLLLRNLEKATTLFGEQEEEKLQVWKGDTRNPENLDPSIFEDVTHVICCSGTTAFPSRRWDGDNTPERVDWEGVKNLVSVLPPTLERIVLVSSVGVTKSNELPWSIMNLFGVLKYKKMGEDFIRNSGLPYTIIRPGRLTDGPYTSYDLNTLLKATTGERRAVLIGQGDKLVGEVSRLVVAEACLQVLDLEFSQGQIYEINSVQGDGPGCDQQKWKELFEAAQLQ